jgi:serine/threonine protein kinase
VVYEGWDAKRNVQKAIKVPKFEQLGLAQDQAGSQLARARAIKLLEMLGEVKTLAEIPHPNIIRVYDMAVDKTLQMPYFVMEWIDGKNAQQRIKDHGPLSVEETLNIIEPVCAALNYAHQIGMVHCDVKPANIMIGKDGRVYVTDFGLAQHRSQQIRGGTPYYMAPEQFQGGTAEPSTDVYALGVTAFQLLTSTLPFRGTHPSSQPQDPGVRLAWEHLNLPPPDVRQFNPRVPGPVSSVIQRALNKSKETRYPTAGQFSIAFDRACEGDVHETEYVERQTPEQGPSRGPRLVGTSGVCARQSFPITEGSTLIGRGRDMTVWVNDRHVSRYQARIIRDRNGIMIENWSDFGTFVNGRSIDSQYLEPGDVIEMGEDQAFEYRE